MQLRVHRRNAAKIRKYAQAIETGEERNDAIAEVFPEHVGREQQVALRAYRTRENLTQKQLADALRVSEYRVFL